MRERRLVLAGLLEQGSWCRIIGEYQTASHGKNPKYNTNAAALSESDIAKIVKLVGKAGE